MLNELYHRLDGLCLLMKVYKVETIGGWVGRGGGHRDAGLPLLHPRSSPLPTCPTIMLLLLPPLLTCPTIMLLLCPTIMLLLLPPLLTCPTIMHLLLPHLMTCPASMHLLLPFSLTPQYSGACCYCLTAACLSAALVFLRRLASPATACLPAWPR